VRRLIGLGGKYFVVIEGDRAVVVGAVDKKGGGIVLRWNMLFVSDIRRD